ncbi:Asp-tRNA(Asn)/Glu-tRNA(Gln) amidotransferase subunit GatC [Patescibacteria group bacterium]|nr:Asp-tRNA(Asn)/Glu-tRNA(Gln) amidotransferase subunit GatC [Patescibacteria group bacterium]
MLVKKDLEKLADLSRIKLKEDEEEKLLKDLGGILNHFEELKEVDTEGVKPMNGGTFSSNVWREDEARNVLDGKKAIAEFPDSEEGYLKVPPVF